MGKYDKMTNDEFHDILEELIKKNVGALLHVPGVYDAVAEYFNNEILDIWEEKQRKWITLSSGKN